MRYTGTKRQVVICVNNEGYPASLERWKPYQAVPDRQADALVHWRRPAKCVLQDTRPPSGDFSPS